MRVAKLDDHGERMALRKGRKLGTVCRDANLNYYVVDRIGPEGGTYGPRFYGRLTVMTSFGSLNSNTSVVRPEEMPEKVVAALAYFRLTGRMVPHDPT